MTDQLKILSLPVGMDACSYYRIKKPFQGIEEIEPGTTHIIDVRKDDTAALPHIFAAADVIFMRPGAENGYRMIKNMKGVDIKAKIVLDIDDNVDEISPLSQFYAEYGLSEATYDGKPLWKHGENGFDLQKNFERVNSLHEMMREVDLITTTTPTLAKYASKFNKNVYVNRNTIDRSVWWRVNHKINKPLKVLWHGSPSHYEDWEEIRKPINKLMGEFDFELYLLGSAYKGLFKKKYLDRVRVYPWTPFEAHSYRCIALAPDMAIIPLVDSEFNRNKSSIKWLEMSAMGIPSLVANRTPYKEDISTKTAVLYENNQQFYDGFKLLLENKGVRANIGNSAYNEINKNHNLTDESKKLLERIKQLCRM